MKTGIELIVEERKNQLQKYSIESDININNDKQLLDASETLTSYSDSRNFSTYEFINTIPNGWNEDAWIKLCNKPYLERLAIAGSLIAAEIDRIKNK